MSKWVEILEKFFNLEVNEWYQLDLINSIQQHNMNLLKVLLRRIFDNNHKLELPIQLKLLRIRTSSSGREGISITLQEIIKAKIQSLLQGQNRAIALTYNVMGTAVHYKVQRYKFTN